MAKIEISLKGNAQIEISPTGLEAFFLFSPEGEQEITGPSILSLLQSANVLFGFKQDDVLAVIEKAAAKKNTAFKVQIAQGLDLIPTQAETISFLDFSEKPEWKPAIEITIKMSPPPEIFKEVIVKIEKEEVHVKKGALPFLPSKEEKVKVVEKVSKAEKIEVDPAIISYGLFLEAQKVAQITPQKPGKPGKTVSGTPILPENIDGIIYLGANLERKGSDVLALCPGIVRQGKNWVDLIPFSDHKLDFEVSDDKATLFMNFIPGNLNIALPSYEKILELTKTLNFEPNQLLPEHDFASLLVGSLESGNPIEKHIITLPADAFYDITISDDGLKAVVNVSKGSGHGKHLVLKELGNAINASGVKLGSKEKVKTDILAFFNSEQKALIGYVLAEGKTPTIPPPQTISITLEELAKKEAEVLRAQLTKNPPPELKDFPIEHLKTIGKAEGDMRVATLGPVVSGQSGFDVMGKVIPATSSEALKVQIFGKIEQSNSFIITKCKGVCLYAEHERLAYFAALEFADAEFFVELDADKMAAYLTIDAHLGLGKALDVKAVEAEIQKQGIKKGIQEEVLKAALAEGASGGNIRHVCIARGLAPQGAAIPKVEFLHSLATGKNVRMHSDGSVDYKNHDAITTVKTGEAIARILPPEYSGQDGYDITGKEIKAQAPGGPEYTAGAGIKTEKNEDGSTTLVATLDGELKKEKGVLTIVQGFTIKGNVDGQSGNIKFPGPVSITGDVLSTFAVMSGADIKINGSVEAALLSAELGILINGGVKGGGKALLRAKTEIMANFIEMATVLVIGDLKIKKAILKSKIKCNGKIMIPDDGVILGGEIKVRTGLYAGNLGSENGIPTKIIFGSDVLVEDQIEVEDKEIKHLQEEINKINTQMKHPSKINDKVSMQELFETKVKNMKMLDKRNLRLFALKEKFEVHHDSEIIIKNTIHPGVIFECHGRSYEVRSPKKNVRIKFDTESGRILETPIESKK